MSTMPLLLWPGLAADHRLFAPLVERMPNVRTPAMIDPRPRELLRDYAARYAESLAPELPAGEPYAVGGFSFGGQLAMGLAAVLDPKPAGIVLMCGVRGRHQFTPAFTWQQRLGAIIPHAIAKAMYVPFAKSFAKRDRLDEANTARLVEMAADIDPAFLNWSARACAAWPGPPPGLDLPIRHVHGELDAIIPDTRRQADTTLAGARHLITLTHADDVAGFLAASLEAFGEEASTTG